MKSLLRLLVIFGFLAPLPLIALAGGGQEKGEFGEEEKSDTPPAEIKVFTRRYLKLKNATSEKVSASIVYRTYINDAWVWQPADPGTGDVVSVDIDPGETVQVQVGDQPVTASRIRIWGSSQSFKWDNNRENDLWTVPEIDMKEHRYSATEMDTYTYTFSAPEGADRGVGEPADSTGTENKGEPSSDPDTTPPPTFTPGEGETNIFGNNNAIAGGDNVPITPGGGFDGGGGGGGISDAGAGGVDGGGVPLPGDLGGGLGGQGTDQPKGTDLAATNFKLTATGDFTGTIQNLGTEDFSSGRQWFVLKSTKGKIKGFDKALAQGAIDPITAGGKQDITGKIPGFTTTAFYVLVLSPGDSNKKNDSSNVMQFTPGSSKSDLAVTLTLAKGQLQGVIKNNGPEDYKGGTRTFKLGDKSGTVTPKEGKVPDLKNGDTFKVNLDVKAALKVNTKFFLTLNAGDEKPANDFAEVANKTAGSGPDLEAKSLVLKGDKLEGIIVNNGPGEYKGGRSYFLGNKDANKSDAIPDLKQGATFPVSLTVAKTVLAKPQTFKLNISEIDGKPGNDSVSVSNKLTSGSDLAVTLKLDGLIIKGKITNVGKDAYDGKSRSFKLFHDKVTYQQASIVKKLKPGESFDITQPLPKNPPAQTIVLELNKGDANLKNDKAEVKFLPTKIDLAVKMKIVGSVAQVTVVNVGVEGFTGKRGFTLSRPGLKNITGDVPGPIAPNNQRTANISLADMLKPGTVTFTLAHTDSNPVNDSASVPFKGPSKGFDLRVDKAEFLKGVFSITVTNQGLTPYLGGDSYTITGPSGFKDGDKIPAVANGKSVTLTHKPKVSPGGGVYQLVLNVKDTEPKDNTFTFKVAPSKGFDLVISDITYSPKTHIFAFKVTNQGGGEFLGKHDTTITGPLGFKEAGPFIPTLVSGASTTLSHKALAKVVPGIYTVALNVKDPDPKHQSGTVKVLGGKAELIIASMSRKGKSWTATIHNSGTGPYSSADGVQFGSRYISKKGTTKQADVAVPNLAAGQSITLPARPDPGVGVTIEGFLHGGVGISPDPSKTKMTIK